ncbi:MAG: FtsX-like permease family protein [Sulfurospirillaceae bacterium]|jgi:ABC-type lipoprotein release transport system permease subunit|nr:FtsX-like permease family protein [Sulfurospirillaceae bacterium]MDY0237991.1 FtsX-like permease family protein [Campylobacterales bacterium]
MNSKLFNYALNSIWRKKTKNSILFFGLIFSLTLLISSLFTAYSLKNMLLLNIEAMPEITVQKTSGGRLENIPVDRVWDLADIPGVQSVTPRVWGYYFFTHRRLQNDGVNFTLVGLDLYKDEYKKSLKELTYARFNSLEDGELLLGKRALETIKRGYFEDFFDFYTPNKEQIRVPIGAVVDGLEGFEDSGMMILPQDIVRKILGVDEEEATDIVLHIPNADEVDTIKDKISQMYPDSRVITKEDLISAYNALFDFKSGLFLALFLSSSFALFLLIFEKSSGLGAAEKQEIGILRAIGWKISDVISVKFAEHAVLVLMAFAFSTIISYIYLFIFNAPILRELFYSKNELTPPFHIVPHVSIALVFGIGLLVAVLYLALVLIPIWRSSIIDPSESVR